MTTCYKGASFKKRSKKDLINVLHISSIDDFDDPGQILLTYQHDKHLAEMVGRQVLDLASLK